MDDKDKRGIVYCLTNPTMPDIVKIGHTKSLTESEDQRKLDSRIRTLSSHTSVPLPFEAHYAVSADDAKKAEGLLHSAFADVRTNLRREFFETDPEHVVAAMKLIGAGGGKEVSTDIASSLDDDNSSLDESEIGIHEDVKITSEDINALNRVNEKLQTKASSLQLSKIGIKEGDILIFSRDHRTAKVVANNKVVLGNMVNEEINYDGEPMSLSASAMAIIREMTGKDYPVSGSVYWTYKGKTLNEIRKSYEKSATEMLPENNE